MSDIKHTPGPWRIHKVRQNLWIDDVVTGNPIAAVRHGRKEEVHARLIAAAPELLLALSWLVGLEDERPSDYDDQKPLALGAARAAIAKAKVSV